MLMFASTPSASVSPTPQQIADLRLAASHMTGATRRAFQAEMTLKYGDGNARRAEEVFGWGRQTVEVGLAEKRTGIACLSLHAAFSGRPRWEDQYPEAAQALIDLALSHSQQDPTFRTSVSYTRLTAQRAIEGLRQQGTPEAVLPAPSTMAVILNRLGFRLRDVVKSKPLKKLPETDAIFANVKKKTRKPRPTVR
jgi:Rhodopirellula transposase DDE domain